MFGSDDIIAEIPRLRRYARALVGSATDADDLVQDTLERAWSKRSLWRAGSDMRAWLFGIMHNLRVDGIRRHSPPTTPIDEEHLNVPVAATQSERLELRDLAAALAQLPEEQREVLLLVAIEEMSYEEVAKATGIPTGTVMSRLSRGRARLHGILQRQHQPAALKVVK
jgi:RNA polymerase sigma factor (sigma-70 family)